MDGLRTEVCGQQKPSNDPRNNQHNPQYANCWAPLTHKRHIHATSSTAPAHQPLGSANAETTPAGAPAAAADRTQRPTERSDPTQHAKGRTGDCPGPRKETTTQRNVTQGGGSGGCCGESRPSCGVPGMPFPACMCLPQASPGSAPFRCWCSAWGWPLGGGGGWRHGSMGRCGTPDVGWPVGDRRRGLRRTMTWS